MGTRGFICFVADGDEKTAYNHYDSYPSGLGLKVLEWAQAVEDWEEVRDQAAAIRLVAPGTPPTPDEIAEFGKYSWTAAEHGGDADLRSGQEWYDLLHETQGDPARILECGVMEEDGRDFPLDGLFAEWGYVIDLDARKFEVYKGFQRAPHTDGRFAGREDPLRIAEQVKRMGYGYYPVALLAAWSLDALPDKDQFAKGTGDREEEE